MIRQLAVPRRILLVVGMLCPLTQADAAASSGPDQISEVLSDLMTRQCRGRFTIVRVPMIAE